MVIEYLEAGVIADEGPFAGGVCLACVGYGVDVEIVLVPLYYLIVGEEFAPRCYASLR